MVVACQIGHGGGRQGGGALLKGAARLELLAEYYNGRIALWEPVLEKVGAGEVLPPSHAKLLTHPCLPIFSLACRRCL